jgi:F0F1-type ATP synthase delta subunit
VKTPRTRIAQTIAAQTLDSGINKDAAKEVAAYLLGEGRVNELDSVMRDVQAAWADAGFVEVIASSAHPLTESIKADITKQVKQLYPNAQQIMVTEHHDQDVIGGVRLSLANQQLDLSVEAKLNKFKQLTTAGKD